jgi:hypothetical protein
MDMAQFLFLYRRSHEHPVLSPAQMQENIPKWQAWFKVLAEQGHLKDRGNPLEREGKLIRGAKKNVTDGPYAEKDLVMGYTLVEADDLDEANELASGCPGLSTEMLVEVRPVMQLNP